VPFPVEQVPDGSVWLAHHFVYAVWAALFVCWMAARDDQKPWVTVGGLLVALFSWYHIWPTAYSMTGATGVLVGFALANLAVVWRRPWRMGHASDLRMICLLCLLIAWDDVLQHAFGLWMPLDWIWKTFLLQSLP